MKTTPSPLHLVVIAGWLALIAVLALGQTGAAATAPGVTVTSTAQFWTFGIAAATPIIVNFLKKAVPQAPSWSLPLICPVLGIALGFAMNWVAGTKLTWIDGAQLGALGIAIRELTNQLVTKQLQPPASTG